MTIQRLEDYKGTIALIRALEYELKSLTPIASIRYDVLKTENNNNYDWFIKREAEIKNNMERQLLIAYNERQELEKWIEQITDNEIKAIVRWRFFQGKKWGWIATQLNYSFPVPKYKLLNYLRGAK